METPICLDTYSLLRILVCAYSNWNFGVLYEIGGGLKCSLVPYISLKTPDVPYLIFRASCI